MKLQRRTVLAAFMSLLFVATQYYFQYRNNERLRNYGKCTAFISAYSEKWGKHFLNYSFVTGKGDTVNGSVTCGSYSEFLRMSMDSIIYDPSQPKLNEFKSGFAVSWPLWKNPIWPIYWIIATVMIDGVFRMISGMMDRRKGKQQLWETWKKL